MAAKTQLKNVEGKKSQQRGGKKSRREHKLSPALRDALITDCVLWNIAKSEKGRCTNDDIHKLLAQHGIALNAVTRCFKKMADGIPEKKIAPLPFFFRYDEGKELALRAAACWYRDSQFYKRLKKAESAKSLIGRLVGNKVRELIKIGEVPLGKIYFDAGTSCLACASELIDELGEWTTLTNNLFIVLHLLHNRVKTRVPPGHPDLDTAAIIEEDRRTLDAWYGADTDVAIVSFHNLVVKGDGTLDFCVDKEPERTAKVAAMQHVTKALFIPMHSGKIGDAASGPATVRLAGRQWIDLTSSDKTGTNATTGFVKDSVRVFFCTEKTTENLTTFKRAKDLMEKAGVNFLEANPAVLLSRLPPTAKSAQPAAGTTVAISS